MIAIVKNVNHANGHQMQMFQTTAQNEWLNLWQNIVSVNILRETQI